MQLPSGFRVRDDFPATSYEAWRTLVEEDLEGAPFEKKLVSHTYEGIDIQPVYTMRDVPDTPDYNGLPGTAPFVRGFQSLKQVTHGAELRQEYSHPDLSVTHSQILSDLAGGVASLQLRFDAAGRQGFDPDQTEGVGLAESDGGMVCSTADLQGLLKGVNLAEIPVALEAGAASLPGAALLAALWQRQKVALATVRGAFNADPLGVLASEGRLPMKLDLALELLCDLAKWTAENCPQVTSVGVSTAAYHCAGATSAQDLAFALATATAYLRSMVTAGLSVADAAKQILFRLELGTHHFLAIAKLRAARQIWSSVLESSGVAEEARHMAIQARTSERVLTRRDPYVNILRNTVAMFAASVGGSDVVTSVPFDSLIRLPDNFSRRIARNTVLVLQEESHLHRVLDPAGGSWFLDKITQDLADEAWKLFQEIERQGGMTQALQCGWVAEQITAAHTRRAKDIALRKEGITGVSEFPNIAEETLQPDALDRNALRQSARERKMGLKKSSNKIVAGESQMVLAVDAAAVEATIGEIARGIGFHKNATTIEAIAARRFAQPFEELRDAVDAWEAAQGKRPTVFLATMGPVAHHTARATYSKNFFEAGGFCVVTGEGYKTADEAAEAFSASGASCAVICSSDKLYPDLVPAVTAQLKKAGAKTVVLAGNPGDKEAEWRSAGVNRFIFVKCDVLASLRDLLCEEGVIEA